MFCNLTTHIYKTFSSLAAASRILDMNIGNEGNLVVFQFRYVIYFLQKMDTALIDHFVYNGVSYGSYSNQTLRFDFICIAYILEKVNIAKDIDNISVFKTLSQYL